MLDHDDRVPGVHEALQHLHEPPHVRHVQTDGRLLENEQIALDGTPLTPSLSPSDGERVAFRPGEGRPIQSERHLLRVFYSAKQVRDELYPLRLAAAQRRAGLSQFQIIKAGVAQRFERAANPRERVEKPDRFGDAQFEDLRDVFPAQFDVECFAAEPHFIARLATYISGRQEVHFEFDRARAFAFGTAALRAVEGETTRCVTAQTGLRELREQMAYLVEKADIGGRRRARRAANRRLVNTNDLVDIFRT